MLIGVAIEAGTVKLLALWISSSVPVWLIPVTITVVAAFMSFFSSTLGVVCPACVSPHVRRVVWVADLLPTFASPRERGADVQTGRSGSMRHPAKVEPDALELESEGSIDRIVAVAPDIDLHFS